MEMYESKRLKKIEVFIPGQAAPVKVVEFTYDYFNKTLGSQFLKSLIKEITWKDNASGKLENRFLFDYYDDVTKADTYEPDYHYGALKEITNTMLGSSTLS